MFKYLKQLAGDSVIYGISGIVSRMISVFLVPLYTRLFSPEDYGVINLVNTSFLLIGLVIVFALDNSAARWYYDTDEITEQKKTFGSWIWFQLIAAIVVAILLISFSSPISVRLLKVDHGGELFIILSSISLIATTLPGVLTNWYRVQRRAKSTVLFTLSQSLATIFLTMLFVLKLRWGVVGVFAAFTVSSILFSIIAIQQMWSWLSIRYLNLIRLKEMLRFALPMLPAALAYWLLNSTDSYFLLLFKNKAEVGLFGVGAMLASGIGLFTGAFQQAWGPFAYSIIDKADAKKIYASVFLYYGYALGFLAACLMMFAPEVLMIFTTKTYYSASWVAGILGYNLMLIGFSYIAMIGISISKTTTPYAMAMLYAAIVTIILDIVLIPIWGKEGSALATVTAQLIVPCYLFYKGQKVYPIPYDFKQVAFVLVLLLMIGVGVRLIPFPNFFVQIITKLTVAFAIILALVFKLKIKSRLFFRKDSSTH